MMKEDPMRRIRTLPAPLAALAVVLVVCFWLRKIDVVPATALLALLWAGLYFSYSQSSYAALFVVVLAVTLVVGDRRGRQVAAITAVAVALVAVGIAAAKVAHTSVRKATSDRPSTWKSRPGTWRTPPT